MLKKQTVWLLTMLSLIVVLSVYALTAQNQNAKNVADQGAKQAQQVSGNNQKTQAVSKADNKLGQIELDKADERSQLQQKYQSVIASKRSSAKAVSAAYDQMEAMQTLANNETMLEDVIQSKGFKNAVVKTTGNNVQVFVDSEKLTQKQANEVIRLTDQYLGVGKIVSVTYALNQK